MVRVSRELLCATASRSQTHRGGKDRGSCKKMQTQIFPNHSYHPSNPRGFKIRRDLVRPPKRMSPAGKAEDARMGRQINPWLRPPGPELCRSGICRLGSCRWDICRPARSKPPAGGVGGRQQLLFRRRRELQHRGSRISTSKSPLRIEVTWISLTAIELTSHSLREQWIDCELTVPPAVFCQMLRKWHGI